MKDWVYSHQNLVYISLFIVAGIAFSFLFAQAQVSTSTNEIIPIEEKIIPVATTTEVQLETLTRIKNLSFSTEFGKASLQLQLDRIDNKLNQLLQKCGN